MESADGCTPIHPPLQPRSHLAALTGLRFVAALHVALYHESARLFAFAPIADRVVGTGFIGVQLFFVLSGFILTYTYTDPAIPRPLDVASFSVARFARVYPVYILSLLVALPTFLLWAIPKASTEGTVGMAKVLVTAVANLTLLQAWVPQTVSQWNTPGWSLSCEAFFYLVFPMVVLRIGRLSSRHILRCAAIVWIAGLIPPILYSVHDPLSTAAQSGMLLTAIKYSPLTRIPEFLIGIACGHLYLRSEGKQNWGGRPNGLWAVGVAIVIVGVLAMPTWIPYPLLHNALLAPLFAVLIFMLASGQGILARCLSYAWVVLLGQASYALYLLHEPLGDLLYEYPSSPLRSLVGWPRLCSYLLIVLACSVAVLRYWEEPSRRAIRRWWKTRETHKPLAGRVSAVP
jgi:peptidoglycan/LPS O-acetylase OafA/YrhL